MAAKTWDEDFRKNAIDASIRKLGDEFLDDPFRYDGSFCLPVSLKTRTGGTLAQISMLLTAGSVGLELCIILHIFCSLVLGASISLWELLLIPAVVIARIAINQLLISPTGEKFLLRRLLKDRVQNRFDEFETDHVIPCELIDPDPSGERRFFVGDDHVLVFLDDDRRRLLIEGVTARYQIRAEDVTRLEKFEWKVTVGADYYPGVLVTFNIDETTELTLAAVRKASYYETEQQILLWFFLSRARRNALKKNTLIGPFKQTLQYSDVSGRAKQEIELEQ